MGTISRAHNCAQKGYTQKTVLIVKILQNNKNRAILWLQSY